MKLYILGKNKNDKGKQLETLTKNILDNQGYTNITLNTVGTGGHEIDVYAEKEQKVGIEIVKYPVICECKAHEKMISMPDYDKFKGKVTTAKEKNKNTIGLLIALSGALGTVVGANNTNVSDIQLIANDDIAKLISQLYSLSSQYNVRQYISAITNRFIIAIDIVYYNNYVYWLISFNNGDYTILNESLNSIEDSTLDIICPLIIKAAPVLKFVDIFQEQKALERKNFIQSFILYCLMSHKCRIKEILNSIKDYSMVTEDEIRNLIEENPYVKEVSDNCYSLLPDEDISYIEFYKFILNGKVCAKMFSQPYYINHIDKNLIEKIMELQHINIPEDKLEDVIFLLKASPVALSYAIKEDERLTNYRDKGGVSDEKIEMCYYSMFFNTLMDLFENDYVNNNSLGDYYMNDLNINSIAIKKELLINKKDGSKHIISQKQEYMHCEILGSIVSILKRPE